MSRQAFWKWPICSASGGLAGLQGGLEKGVDLVKDADDDLDPFGLAAAEFVGFQPQVDAFHVVGFLQELGEVLGFGGHALGHIGGGLGGFGGGVLDDLPLGGGVADLRGQFSSI